MDEQEYTLLEKPQLNRSAELSAAQKVALKIATWAGIAMLPYLGFQLGRFSYALTGPPVYSGHELPSDVFFGNIPRERVAIELEDQRFIDTEPITFYPNGTRVDTLWDTIYSGAWVAVSNPAKAGLKGKGMPMATNAEDPGTWPAGTEGFVVAGMHQLHCLMSLKQAYMFWDTNNTKHTSPGKPMQPDREHLDHCMELLRRAVMCNGDLALDPLEVDENGQYGETVGGLHMCRDWNQVYKAVMAKRITLSTNGWVDSSEDF